MKKHLILALITLCSGCSGPTQEQMRQEISQDVSIKYKFIEIQFSDDYPELIKKVKTLKTLINKKKIFSKSDYNTVNNYYDTEIKSTSDLYEKYWGTELRDETKCKNDNTIQDQMCRITTNIKTFALEKCKERVSFWQTIDEKKRVLSECDHAIKTYFSALFKRMSTDEAVFLQTKMNEYNTKQWEQKTGCKADKTQTIPPIYKVLQQTKDGTLTVLRFNGPVYAFPEMFLIVKNKHDSALVDGDIVYSGVFQDMGNYQYTTVTGSVKTIKKYKRCE